MKAAGNLLSQRSLLCLLVGIAALASWWPRWGGPIDLRWDGGAYYLLGTSLRLGEGYRLLSEPGTLQSSLHAPFLPLFVAVHEFLLQSTDPIVVGRALRTTIAFCSAAYAMAVFLLLSARLPQLMAAALALLCVLQPQYVYFSDALYAETFFGLFTVLFFVVRAQRNDATGFLLCGLCACLAYEARTVGIVLLGIWVIDHALRKEPRRAVGAFFISAILVANWMSWIKFVEASAAYQHPAYSYQTEAWLYFNVSYARNLSTYFDPWRPDLGPLTTNAFVGRLFANAKLLPLTLGQAVSAWEAPVLFSRCLGVLVVGGLLLQAKRREFTLILYVVLSIAAICTTPFQKQFVRYLLPLFPFLAMALFELLVWAAEQARRRWPALPPALFMAIPWLVMLVIGLRTSSELRHLYKYRYDQVAYQQHGQPVRYRLFHYAPEGTDFDAALDFLDRRATRDEIIVAGDPQWVYLRTGRRAVLPPFLADGKAGQKLVDSVPARYLLAYSQEPYVRFTAPILAANPNLWRRVWKGAHGTIDVYERVGNVRR